ncbi:hypothetical protein HAX54_019303 [Datura stramonium]|uniref:Uncharacterized protein n=1 Tax=Datura stramonium TaxID=4076 RepID=A0ABS8UR36_DATST|nr:hypothetical protein [Datura stramonium]
MTLENVLIDAYHGLIKEKNILIDELGESKVERNSVVNGLSKLDEELKKTSRKNSMLNDQLKKCMDNQLKGKKVTSKIQLELENELKRIKLDLAAQLEKNLNRVKIDLDNPNPKRLILESDVSGSQAPGRVGDSVITLEGDMNLYETPPPVEYEETDLEKASKQRAQTTASKEPTIELEPSLPIETRSLLINHLPNRMKPQLNTLMLLTPPTQVVDDDNVPLNIVLSRGPHSSPKSTSSIRKGPKKEPVTRGKAKSRIDEIVDEVPIARKESPRERRQSKWLMEIAFVQNTEEPGGDDHGSKEEEVNSHPKRKKEP